MVLVSCKTEIPQLTDRIRYPDVDLSGLNRSEIIEEPSPMRTSPIPSPSAQPFATTITEEAIYVALGKEEKEAEVILTWALRNSGGRKIIILHVHQPAQKILMLGANVPIDRLEENFVEAHQKAQRQKMYETLNQYISTCKRAGVRADKLYIEMESIEKGIVELISLHGIKKLVMGAAARNQYSKKMMGPKSKKAMYVHLQAPVFCDIWFICKGHLINRREGTPTGISLNISSPVLPENPSSETGQYNSLMSRSLTQVQNGDTKSRRSVSSHRRIHSDNYGVKFTALSPSNSTGSVTTHSRLSVEGSNDGWDWMSRRSPSVGSRFSSCSSSEIVDDAASVSITQTERSGNESDMLAVQQFENERLDMSPSSRVPDGNLQDELFDRLQQYVEEAENSRREAYEESIRRGKAEKKAIEARRKAQVSETMFSDELKKRKEIEESLARAKEENQKMKLQLDEVKENLRAALEQKSSLESQIVTSDEMVEDLKQKMFSAVELLQKYKQERDELEAERDNALTEAEELRKFQAEGASTSHLFSEYSFSEIEEATHNFDPTLKIGEGGYGSIYKGLLRHTKVAIKVLHPDSTQGPMEFQQEVNILSKLRHPNVVTLIGACPEAWALVYEYLPNGSLEDRLSCKDNSSPLSWQTRIRIAAELCSVLIFLHSRSPQGIVHGDLKPANILLDANYVSKLGDFGICRVLCQDEFSENNNSFCWRTDPKGTFAYMDPEFVATGELTSKSDVYSFGIILLRLLTGKSAFGITKEVEYALSKGNLKDVLDPTAGDWPFVQAKQLAHLAISCCEMNRRNRPELSLQVWKVVEPMRAYSCSGTSSSSRLNSGEQSYVPSYFICPIFQEAMQDPVVAADGFTYEAEALKGWLDSGHDTSPMTNLKLPHSNFVPNHALRSAIQEWFKQT